MLLYLGVYFVVGRNGMGKMMFCKVIMGLEFIVFGIIVFCG